MAPTLNTRKPVVELLADDLRFFPVWEYALDEEGSKGRDETWIRPFRLRQIPKEAYSLLVAADFQIASGKSLQGFMVVTTAEGKADVRPGAIISRGYFVLPAMSRKAAVEGNCTWVIQDRTKLLNGLKAVEKQVFPIKFRLRVAISGEANRREGLIP